MEKFSQSKEQLSETKYFQSEIGKPYAIRDGIIATYTGRSKTEHFFEIMTVEEFEKKCFPVKLLREIREGMPEVYKSGLDKALAFENSEKPQNG
jgi:hypothetical protein